jgi:mono/diheme cytochrome c family protein
MIIRTTLVLGAALMVVLALVGCGGKKAEQAESNAAPGATPAVTPPAAAAPFVVPADLDQGPRAGESPVDQSLVAQGQLLFSSKTCATCHGFGKKIQCPDLKPVAMQRTERWLEAQIMHPDVMTKQDPASIQLMKQYSLQMPNMNLTQDQAKALIEYIKKNGK